MKVTFRTDYNGNIMVANEKENNLLNENGITLDYFKVAKDIAIKGMTPVTELLAFNGMFVAVPTDKVGDKNYVVYDALYIKGQGGLVYFNGEMMRPENGDCIYTTYEEAKKVASAKNEIHRLEEHKKDLFKEVRETEKKVEKLKASII